MIRDEELNRLIRYAQGMGISVRFKPYVKSYATDAEWATDGSEITIYTRSINSKLDKILSLIHELGHHKGFVENNRKIDPEIEEALEEEEKNKKNRKKIYLDEIKDTQYWEQIYKDTNCQFNIQKLYKQREFDIWSYEVYSESGKFPTKSAIKEKKRQLKKKYSC